MIAVIEAMKMMNEIRAHRSGTVAEVYTAAGDPIESGRPSSPSPRKGRTRGSATEPEQRGRAAYVLKMARDSTTSGIPLQPAYDAVQGTAHDLGEPGEVPLRSWDLPGRCIVSGFGRCASTPVSRPRRNRMRVIAICSSADKPVSRSPSTYRRSSVTIPTHPRRAAKWVRPA